MKMLLKTSMMTTWWFETMTMIWNRIMMLMMVKMMIWNNDDGLKVKGWGWWSGKFHHNWGFQSTQMTPWKYHHCCSRWWPCWWWWWYWPCWWWGWWLWWLGGKIRIWGCWGSSADSNQLNWSRQSCIGVNSDDDDDDEDIDSDDDDDDDDDASHQMNWCNENTTTRETGRGQEIARSKMIMAQLCWWRYWFCNRAMVMTMKMTRMRMMRMMIWGGNEEAFGEQGAMVGWSNYVLDTGKKLSCPTRGPEHATLHQCFTENNPDKAFSGGVRC